MKIKVDINIIIAYLLGVENLINNCEDKNVRTQ